MSPTSGLRAAPVFALMAVALLAVTGSAGFAMARKPSPAPPTTAVPVPPPKASVLIDADTGRVLDAVNDHSLLPPASLTKVITALAVGDLAPGTDITVSDRAAAAPADKLFMKAGSVWTADELLHELLISSANDAAVALAENVGASLEGFQQIFARTALGLGMADHPVLMDPAGLDGPDGVDGGNLVSARDLAIAARALLAKPTLAQIAATPVYYFDGPDGVHHRLTNHNKAFLTSYGGAVGVKTGYTRRAGACLIAAATRDGRTMLAVVLSGANPTQQAKDLLDKGFAIPVSAEPLSDRLPAVNGAAAAAATPSTAAAPTSVATRPPGPSLAAAARSPSAARAGTGLVGRIRAMGSSGPGLAIAALVLSVALIGFTAARVAAAKRRRHRIFRDPPDQASDDRRAA